MYLSLKQQPLATDGSVDLPVGIDFLAFTAMDEKRADSQLIKKSIVPLCDFKRSFSIHHTSPYARGSRNWRRPLYTGSKPGCINTGEKGDEDNIDRVSGGADVRRYNDGGLPEASDPSGYRRHGKTAERLFLARSTRIKYSNRPLSGVSPASMKPEPPADPSIHFYIHAMIYSGGPTFLEKSLHGE